MDASNTQPSADWMKGATCACSDAQDTNVCLLAVAAGASQVDLMVTSSTRDHHRPNLPIVTVVFATVESGASFEARHTHQECHALHKAIMKVMQQQLNHLPGRDGYISRYVWVLWAVGLCVFCSQQGDRILLVLCTCVLDVAWCNAVGL